MFDTNSFAGVLRYFFSYIDNMRESWFGVWTSNSPLAKYFIGSCDILTDKDLLLYIVAFQYGIASKLCSSYKICRRILVSKGMGYYVDIEPPPIFRCLVLVRLISQKKFDLAACLIQYNMEFQWYPNIGYGEDAMDIAAKNN